MCYRSYRCDTVARPYQYRSPKINKFVLRYCSCEPDRLGVTALYQWFKPLTISLIPNPTPRPPLGWAGLYSKMENTPNGNTVNGILPFRACYPWDGCLKIWVMCMASNWNTFTTYFGFYNERWGMRSFPPDGPARVLEVLDGLWLQHT